MILLNKRHFSGFTKEAELFKLQFQTLITLQGVQLLTKQQRMNVI